MLLLKPEWSEATFGQETTLSSRKKTRKVSGFKSF